MTCALSAILSLFPALVGAQARAAERCFPETGFCVEGRFLDYWNAHGGLAINGYPLAPERQEKLEDGKYYWVQWFERVRMEYHPQNPPPFQVLLGQFGRIIHPADPPVGPQPGMRHFGETGHNVPPDFMAYWNGNGGLPQFGFPLSELFRERLEDGREYEVQYFERARFERHPENSPPSAILLGQFGRRILNAPWGPVLAPLASDYFMFNDVQGRYSARIPDAWSLREDASAESVFFRDPVILWGAELALNYAPTFSVVDQADEVIDGQVSQRPNYRLLSLDKVNVGPHKAFRRVFEHTNDEGQQEIIVRIYFLVSPWLYNVNGFMLSHDYELISPFVDGIAGSIVVHR
jgi:hypothetical protein